MPNTELFRFLAAATFGSFLFEDQLPDCDPTDYNFYHRALLACSLHRPAEASTPSGPQETTNGPLPDLVPTETKARETGGCSSVL
jgi:hypothetical protein